MPMTFAVMENERMVTGMAEYIEREALRNAVESIDWYSVCRGKLTTGAKSSENALYKANDIYAAIDNAPSADVAPVRRGRWDDEHKCTVCRNEAFCKISNIQPDYDYDWEENLVETGGYIWDTEWLETTYCPHCGAKMDGGAD